MSQFLRVDNNDSADAKAIAIPRVFSENSRAKTTIVDSIQRIHFVFLHSDLIGYVCRKRTPMTELALTYLSVFQVKPLACFFFSL